jgi:sialic acid synthase SpsE
MEDLCWVRPGKGIRPGEEEKVVGRTLRRDVRTGEVILLEDLA